jgi:hypothetical protein
MIVCERLNARSDDALGAAITIQYLQTLPRKPWFRAKAYISRHSRLWKRIFDGEDEVFSLARKEALIGISSSDGLVTPEMITMAAWGNRFSDLLGETITIDPAGHLNVSNQHVELIVTPIELPQSLVRIAGFPHVEPRLLKNLGRVHSDEWLVVNDQNGNSAPRFGTFTHKCETWPSAYGSVQ